MPNGPSRKGPLKKGYILLDTSIQYDKSVCGGYEWNLARVGGTLVGSDTFKNDDLLINSQITRLANAIRDQGVDHIMLCSYTPGGAAAIKQIRAAGIQLPVLAATAMDGTYWLGSVPGLTDFYVPVMAVAGNDSRDAVQALTARYKQAYGAIPATQYAYPAYPFLDLWAKAVTAAGTTDGAKVVAELNKDTSAENSNGTAHLHQGPAYPDPDAADHHRAHRRGAEGRHAIPDLRADPVGRSLSDWKVNSSLRTV